MSSFKKGFTLIELLVVISIVSLLSAIVFSSLNNARSKAGDAKVEAVLKSMVSQATYFVGANGTSYVVADPLPNFSGILTAPNANVGGVVMATTCSATLGSLFCDTNPDNYSLYSLLGNFPNNILYYGWRGDGTIHEGNRWFVAVATPDGVACVDSTYNGVIFLNGAPPTTVAEFLIYFPRAKYGAGYRCTAF